MLTVETIGRIRREHFLKGKTIKEIARDLKVSRNTVRRVLRSGATSFEYEREVQPRPKLGRWTTELDELLTSNAAKAAPPAECDRPGVQVLTAGMVTTRSVSCDTGNSSAILMSTGW